MPVGAASAANKKAPYRRFFWFQSEKISNAETHVNQIKKPKESRLKPLLHNRSYITAPT
jgi:hypothetical protein